MTVNKTRSAFGVKVNHDLTEGRGPMKWIHFAWREATARRLARGKNVQGSDGEVLPVKIFEIGGVWYAPITLGAIETPTAEEDAESERLEKKRAALKRAQELGLSEEEIELLK